MCNIQLIGIKSTRYNEVHSLITSYIHSKNIDINLCENNEAWKFPEFNISSIPTVNYRSLTLGLGNVPNVENALQDLFEALETDVNTLTYRCNNSGIFHQCRCY